jgi:hypothetical protein
MLRNSAQKASLTRPPRHDDGDDGDVREAAYRKDIKSHKNVKMFEDGVKNPEGTRFVDAAMIRWILRFAQNDASLCAFEHSNLSLSISGSQTKISQSSVPPVSS